MNKYQLETIESYNKTADHFTNKIAKLDNYNSTYDTLIKTLVDGDSILDLACGPGQISKYILGRVNVSITGVDLSHKMLEIAQESIPKGTFINHSIVDYKSSKKYQAVVIGFGIPYLTKEQTEECIKNAADNLLNDKHLYISFMQGTGSRLENTSFGGDNKFNIYYHQKDDIKQILAGNGLGIRDEFEIDYKETDGTITTDVVLIARKLSN